jgi:hypothetical protein
VLDSKGLATSLKTEADRSDPWIGRTLGGTYEIVSVLGEGGMGRIYEARHLRLPHRHVAVKVLGEEYVTDAEIVARFEREVESASRVVHPHVIEVYDAGVEGGVPFLVSELLVGEDLGARIDRTHAPVAVDLAVRLVRQTCRALAAAHERGVIHRDVKPENVFVIQVDGAPFVKVLDFGISKIVRGGGERAKLTRAGAVLGTPAYMAPEQARGREVDARTDVYGAGATLYAALTGHSPFEAEDAAAALTKLLHEDPPPVRSFAPDVPPELEVVVQRAMAKETRDRYASAAELDDALAPFDRDAAPVASPREVPPEVPRGARAAVLFYALLLGVFWIAGASTAAAALVRHARHAQAMTASESFLVLACVGVATFVLSASVLGRTREAWSRDARVLDLLADRRRAVFFAVAVYALGCLAVRFAVMFVLPAEAAQKAEVWLDAYVFGASAATALVVAAIAWVARRIARLRRK